MISRASIQATGPELVVVLPVFNEERAIERVIREWSQEIARWTSSFVWIVIDDGSKDRSGEILDRLAVELAGRLEVTHQKNRGHAPSCLTGYAQALRQSARWILQIDSDGQSDPRYFGEFWESRQQADAIFGVRVERRDGIARRVSTRLLELLLWLRTGYWSRDPNVPYRLIRSAVLRAAVSAVPADYPLGNIVLSASLQSNPKVRTVFIPIVFPKRYGGQSTASFRHFARSAVTLWRHYPPDTKPD